MSYRSEKDSMGEILVPQEKYWGAQTQRAKNNFNVSPLRIQKQLIQALALVKKHAAKTNKVLNAVPSELADAIIQSADKVIAGEFDDNFPIDVMQTGSGTSWNMNMNEVIANCANELLGQNRNEEGYSVMRKVHPNDHVNRGQSSNDSIPTAIYIACRLQLDVCIDQVAGLVQTLENKAEEFKDLIKIGRTHLQDAVPMTLGQEFSAFAAQVEFARKQLARCRSDLEEIPQGGTAVGTGLNSAKGFAETFARSLSEDTGVPFRHADNTFARMAAAEPFAALMGAVSVLAIALLKIANDIRLLASGPRTSIAEIILPELQPGSSIMPGKINPVIAEMTIQSAAHILGKAESVRLAAQNGPLQLIMMYPLIAHECITGLELAGNTSRVFNENCMRGITANQKRTEYWIEQSLALVTPLALKIGYDKAAELAHRAYHENRTIREILLEEAVLDKAEIDKFLDPATMI